MPRPDLEQRLRRELRELSSEPSPALRGRILRALGEAPDRRLLSNRAEVEDQKAALRALRRYPFWVAGLAAGLMALATLRALESTDPLIEVEREPTVALAGGFPGSMSVTAAGMESGLFAQADLLAEDARRTAVSLLERMPAAPWGRRSDSR